MPGKVFDLRTEEGRKAFYKYCEDFERDDHHYLRILSLRFRAQAFYKKHVRSIFYDDNQDCI